MSRNRQGFTLIELLVVTVLIGILAALGMTRFSAVRNRALVAAMQSDLRNLVTVQEAYYTDNNDQYAHDVDALRRYRFSTSSGVRLRSIAITERGWRAEAEHPASRTVCAVRVEGESAPDVTCTSSSGAGGK